jgi:hypothetical protein
MECGVKPAQAGATPLCDIRQPLTFGKKRTINELTPFFVLVFILLIFFHLVPQSCDATTPLPYHSPPKCYTFSYASSLILPRDNHLPISLFY